jgi:excisionase family DNA binding protein
VDPVVLGGRGKITKRNSRILTTNEEVIKSAQGDVITAGELADLLQLHPSMRLRRSTIYRLLRRGKLPAFRIGADWGFSREAVDRIVHLENRQ